MSSVSGESNFQNYPETFELNSETVSRCVSVLCPDSSGSVLVAFSPAIVNGDMTDFIEFSVEANPALPANTASSGAESVYHATWTETDFDNSGTGVYRSLAACEAPGAATAITYVLDMCHFRVDVETISRSVLFNFQSTVSDNSNDLQNFPETFEPNSGTVSRCVPVVCPDSSNNVLVAFSPAIENGDLSNFLEFSVEANPALPANTAPPGAPSVYHTFWSEAEFDNSGTGVYRSLAACEAPGAATAITYVHNSLAQEMDASFLKVLTAQTGKKQGQISPKTTTQIPAELVALMLWGSTPATVTKAEEKEEVSDAQLMSDLEDALRSLQN